jgi:hypothetical protein
MRASAKSIIPVVILFILKRSILSCIIMLEITRKGGRGVRGRPRPPNNNDPDWNFRLHLSVLPCLAMRKALRAVVLWTSKRRWADQQHILQVNPLLREVEVLSFGESKREKRDIDLMTPFVNTGRTGSVKDNRWWTMGIKRKTDLVLYM